MRANTRPRVSAPTSAQPRTTLDTVMTETFRSCAMSFSRTGELGGLDMVRQCAHRHARTGGPKREYIKLGIGGRDPVLRSPLRFPSPRKATALAGQFIAGLRLPSAAREGRATVASPSRGP